MKAYLDEQEQTEIVIGLTKGLLSQGGSPQASSATVPPNTGNYPVLQSGQTGFKKDDIYYSPKVGPVIWTGTGFKPVTS